ncbi:hypothetical protein EV182_002325, partial [Spiromyces aspiralis]
AKAPLKSTAASKSGDDLAKPSDKLSAQQQKASKKRKAEDDATAKAPEEPANKKARSKANGAEKVTVKSKKAIATSKAEKKSPTPVVAAKKKAIAGAKKLTEAKPTTTAAKAKKPKPAAKAEKAAAAPTTKRVKKKTTAEEAAPAKKKAKPTAVKKEVKPKETKPKKVKKERAPKEAKVPKPRPIVFPKRKLPHQVNKFAERAVEVGKVFVFGSGDCGQLGLTDDVLERKHPFPVATLSDANIVDIASGGMHNMAITSEGRLWSWGCNDQRALGRSGEEFEPHPVEGMDEVEIVKVACSDSATIAVSKDGYVYACGTFRSAEGIMGFSADIGTQETLKLMTDLLNEYVVDVVVGADHVLALTAAGEVYTWGNGQQSQLGRRIIERRRNDGLRPAKLSLSNIVAIGAGAYHSFAVDADGTLFSWGLNNFYQCGLNAIDGGDQTLIEEPTEVAALRDVPVAKAAGGEHHSVVLARNGDVYTFGRSDSYQTGLPFQVIPHDALPESEKKREAAKTNVTNGSDNKGEDGHSGHKKAIILPTKLPGFSNIVDVACGSNHTLAINSDHKVFSWGYGEMNQLGNGGEGDEKTPHELTGQKIQGLRVLKVCAGGQHSVILCA